MSQTEEVAALALRFAQEVNTLRGESSGGGGGAVYNSGIFGVQDYEGILAWTVPPELCSTQQTVATGTMIFARFKVPESGTVARVFFGVTNAAAGLTLARVQVYRPDGSLIGQTANLSALLGAGDKNIAFETPFEVVAGEELWIVLYSTGTTGPTIRSTAISPSINVGLTTAAPLRTGRKTGITADQETVVKTQIVAFSNQIPFFALGT